MQPYELLGWDKMSDKDMLLVMIFEHLILANQKALSQPSDRQLSAVLLNMKIILPCEYTLWIIIAVIGNILNYRLI